MMIWSSSWPAALGLAFTSRCCQYFLAGFHLSCYPGWFDGQVRNFTGLHQNIPARSLFDFKVFLFHKSGQRFTFPLASDLLSRCARCWQSINSRWVNLWVETSPKLSCGAHQCCMIEVWWCADVWWCLYSSICTDRDVYNTIYVLLK